MTELSLALHYVNSCQAFKVTLIACYTTFEINAGAVNSAMELKR